VFALLTRRLVRDHEPAALLHGLRWFCRHHVATLWRALRGRSGTIPLDLICSEIAGCAAGPAAYARSARALRSGSPR
jgi:hypothetical protein